MLGLYFGRGLGGEALNPWVDTYLPPQLQASSQSPANPVERGMDVHSLPWLDRLDQALVQAKMKTNGYSSILPATPCQLPLDGKNVFSIRR